MELIQKGTTKPKSKVLYLIIAFFISSISIVGLYFLIQGTFRIGIGMKPSSVANKSLATIKYAGTYEIVDENGTQAMVKFYPETDNKILFYYEITSGGPQYRSGAISGRATLTNNTALSDPFTSEDYLSDCSLIFIFNDNSVSIDKFSSCGMGDISLIENTTLILKSNEIPKHFINLYNGEIYFFSNFDSNPQISCFDLIEDLVKSSNIDKKYILASDNEYFIHDLDFDVKNNEFYMIVKEMYSGEENPRDLLITTLKLNVDKGTLIATDVPLLDTDSVPEPILLTYDKSKFDFVKNICH